jgi:hypothetical protein
VNYGVRINNPFTPDPVAYFRNDGNVGIGTSFPIARLHIFNGHVMMEDRYFLRSRIGGSPQGVALIGTEFSNITIGEQFNLDYQDINIYPSASANYGVRINNPFTPEPVAYFRNDGNVGIGTQLPLSTLEIVGGFGTKVSTQTGSTAVTLNNTASVWYFTGTASVTLPTASSCTSRRYTIINRNAAAKTITSFTNLSGIATTSIAANSSIEIISNGTNWLQIR